MPDLLCMGEPLLEFNQQPDGRYLEGFGIHPIVRLPPRTGELLWVSWPSLAQTDLGKILDYWAEDNIDISL